MLIWNFYHEVDESSIFNLKMPGPKNEQRKLFIIINYSRSILSVPLQWNTISIIQRFFFFVEMVQNISFLNLSCQALLNGTLHYE